jgi:hypothetical protein
LASLTSLTSPSLILGQASSSHDPRNYLRLYPTSSTCTFDSHTSTDTSQPSIRAHTHHNAKSRWYAELDSLKSFGLS